MSADSVGVYGCPVEGTTPNLDRLAAQGLRFGHAHVNVSLCVPSRTVLATGRYAHRNGVEGFRYLSDARVETVHELLGDAGYRTGVIGKLPHSDPRPTYHWDLRAKGFRDGLSIDRIGRITRDFVAQSVAEGRPFYLNVNISDPHRPFFGSEPGTPADAGPPSHVFTAEEIAVPAFLPDLPDVRRDLACYYSSVRRADDCVGAVLAAIAEAGAEQSTLLVFLSDNGMAFPFGKGTCYPQGTRTPWIVRWPGKTRPGAVDDEHMISAIDFLPTALAAAGLPVPGGVDGRSLLPILLGGRQEGRDAVFTQFYETSDRDCFPTRCILTRGYAYIFSPWAGSGRPYRSDFVTSPSFRGMLAAAAHDPAVAARVEFCRYRAVEELYDLERDPDALHDLIDDPTCRAELDRLRDELGRWMQATGDPALDVFRQRDSAAARAAFVQQQQQRRATDLATGPLGVDDLLSAIDFGRMTAAEATRRLPELGAIPDDARAVLDRRLLDLEVREALAPGTPPERIIAAGHRFLALERAGRVPDGDTGILFYGSIMAAQEAMQDAAGYARSLDALRRLVGDDPGAAPALRGLEGKLQRLRHAGN